MNNFYIEEIIEQFDKVEKYVNFSNAFELFYTEATFDIDNTEVEQINELKDAVEYLIFNNHIHSRCNLLIDFLFDNKSSFENIHLLSKDERSFVEGKLIEDCGAQMDNFIDDFEIPLSMERKFKKIIEKRLLNILNFYSNIKMYRSIKSVNLSFYDFLKMRQD